MPSESDRRYADVMAVLTGAGGPAEIVRDARGVAVVDTLPATLDGFFRGFCAQHGDMEALVAGDERLRFADLDSWSERLARALAGGHGIRKGDRVAIAMRNCPAWIVAYMAVLKAGGIATLVNGWWTPEEMQAALALVDPKLVIADAERARRCRMPGDAPAVAMLPIERPLAEALAPLLDTAIAADLPAIDPDDDATILFTSGSTGTAKGAVSTHRAVTTAVYTFMTLSATILQVFHNGNRTERGAEPAVLVAVPLFHVTGEVPVFLNSIAVARKMVLMPRWDAGEALRLIAEEQISYFVGVPTMSLELMQHPDRVARDASFLIDIAAGGAARPVAHVPRLKIAFPDGNPMAGYGLTETNAVGCTNYRDNYVAKPASTGPAQAPFVEIAVFDAAGALLAPGATGEIGIRSAANFRGYWDNPQATAKAFTADGHFLTGDLGYLDADGYLFIVDRAKDIIIRGGENIACLEVEAALYAHPAIAEAAVFGLPCDRLGEVPAAVVHLEDGAILDIPALNAFLATRLAKYKLPTRVWVESAPLPKLGTGKIDKKRLRADHRDAPAASGRREEIRA